MFSEETELPEVIENILQWSTIYQHHSCVLDHSQLTLFQDCHPLRSCNITFWLVKNTKCKLLQAYFTMPRVCFTKLATELVVYPDHYLWALRFSNKKSSNFPFHTALLTCLLKQLQELSCSQTSQHIKSVIFFYIYLHITIFFQIHDTNIPPHSLQLKKVLIWKFY